MKAIIIIIGILLSVFGLASFAYNHISFSPAEQAVQLEGLDVIYRKLNILAISPTLGAIILAIGLVLIIYGFSRES